MLLLARSTTRAKPILMDRLATQAPNAHPKVINSIWIADARAQGTSHNRQKSVCGILWT